MDVVYPIGIGSKWDNNELKYSLRSLERNFIGLGNIYIVGKKPHWIKNVIHIEAEDIYKKNKDANLIRKVLLACEEKELSLEFLRMSDDQIILKPVLSYTINPLHNGELHKVLKKWSSKDIKINRWGKRLLNTAEVLLKEGKPIFEYDTHSPVVYHKYKFKKVMQHYDYTVEGGGYTINTLYFNNIISSIKQHNYWEGIKIGFGSHHTKEQLKDKIGNHRYIGYDDKALNNDMKEILNELFPDKSIYEK